MKRMRLKRGGMVLLAVGLVLAIAACGGGDTASETTDAGPATSEGAGAETASTVASGGTHRIAFFTDSLDNAYLQAAVDEAQKVADERGVELDVISAEWDPNKQLTQVQDAVSSGNYDALVVESIDGAVLCDALTAAAADMVVSIYNAPICGNNETLFTEGTIGFFGRNEYQSGQLLAEQIAEALGGQGKIAYVSGPVQVGIVQTTTKGIKDKLAEYPGIELVSELDGGWDPAKGLAATQDLLQANPDIDGIIYGVDQMAVPSIGWLQESNNLGDIEIVTLGGTSEGFQLIQDGVIHSSVNSLPREEAGYALTAAIDVLEGNEVDVPGWDASTKVYNVLEDPNQPPVVNKDNVGSLEAEWGV